MKYSYAFLAIFFSIVWSVTFCQDTSKVFELKGRIDPFGNPTIEIIPKSDKSYTLKNISEINSIIGKEKGKSVDVLNRLYAIGFKLISALYVGGDNTNNVNGNYLIYYLIK